MSAFLNTSLLAEAFSKNDLSAIVSSERSYVPLFYGSATRLFC